VRSLRAPVHQQELRVIHCIDAVIRIATLAVLFAFPLVAEQLLKKGEFKL